MNFIETNTKLYNHLISLNPDSQEYARKLLAYSSVVEKMFPQEFHQLMVQSQVSQKMEVLSKVSMDMITELDRYQIDSDLKEIKVFMDNQTLTAPLIDLKDYIRKNFKIEKESDYLMILSYLVRINNFEIIQIAECIINA